MPDGHVTVIDLLIVACLHHLSLGHNINLVVNGNDKLLLGASYGILSARRMQSCQSPCTPTPTHAEHSPGVTQFI
jgi:hypothetical protein